MAIVFVRTPSVVNFKNGSVFPQDDSYYTTILFPSTLCCGAPFLLAVTVLAVIVEFPLFGPPRENGGYSFRADPSRR